MEQEINGKVQKINDEDYEIIKIIETKTYPGAIRWYRDSYSCEIEEAIQAIDTIKKKYGVDHVGLYADIDREDLVLMHSIVRVVALNNLKTSEIDVDEVQKGNFELGNWVVKKTGWPREKAFAESFEAEKEELKRWREMNPNASKGCVITLLVGITSTLSIGSLIAYFI